MNLATIVLLYRFVRELFDPFSAGMAAIAYAILSESPALLGMAAHATHFVAFFGLAGTYLLWRHLQSGRWWLLLPSGFLLGTAFLMKQQGVFLMVFGGAVVAVHTLAGLVRASREPQPGTTSSLKLILQAAAFCITVVLPYGIVCLWLWRAGVFDKFWFWTVTYAREYVGEIPLAYAWQSFRQGEGSRVIVADWTAWTLALVGCVGVAIRYRARPGRALFLFCFLLCSFLCVCPGFYFRSHYFVVMLPAVAMLAGAACGDFLRLANLWRLPFAAAPAAAKESHGRRKKSRPKPAAEPAATFAVDDSGSTGRAGDGRLADLAVPGVLLPVAAGDCLPPDLYRQSVRRSPRDFQLLERAHGCRRHGGRIGVRAGDVLLQPAKFGDRLHLHLRADGSAASG